MSESRIEDVLFNLGEQICRMGYLTSDEQRELADVASRNAAAVRILAIGDAEVKRFLGELGATCHRTQTSAIRDALMRLHDARALGELTIRPPKPRAKERRLQTV